jgi:hypothetical protein
MKTLNARTPVKGGYYFSLKTWTIQPVANDGELLAGEAGEKFIPMSLPLAVLAAPLLGAAFLMFMPFIGFYLVAMAAARPITNLFQKTTTELAATMSPGLVPGAAYLTGKAGEKEVAKVEGAAGEERELDALEAEIDERRTPKA